MLMLSQPTVSVVIPTYNRSELLRHALLALLKQDASRSTFEIIVVDNNSSDGTRATVQTLVASSAVNLRYLREQRQGNAYARNSGIKSSRGLIIAFLDDDVLVPRDWVSTLKAAFDAHHDLSFVGGKILPLWHEPPPSWLTAEHWSPLALIDYGLDELEIAGQNPLGLLTANIAFRREVFDELGMFSPRLQRVKNTIGSLEDHEFLLRVCRSGKKGKYIPHLIATAPIERERLTKDYHRRWHTGHGRFYAMMKDPEWERTNVRLLGVPAHLYRQTAWDALIWIKNKTLRRSDKAFINERQLRFFAGFFLQRQKDLFSTNCFISGDTSYRA
jgi:glycosyltransferase involved in cell wall biosynthesis